MVRAGGHSCGSVWGLQPRALHPAQRAHTPHDRIHPLTLSTGTWSEVVKDTLLGAINTQLVQPGDEIVSIYHR